MRDFMEPQYTYLLQKIVLKLLYNCDIPYIILGGIKAEMS